MIQRKFFKANEIGKKLRVSERTILRYIRSKKLPATKIGHWRVLESDFEKFLKSRMNIKPRKRAQKSNRTK